MRGEVMIEVQCTSCHTRYRIDEQVLPDGTPTFKCSRCGHVFSIDPRSGEKAAAPVRSAGQRLMRPRAEAKLRPPAEETPAPTSSAAVNGIPGAFPPEGTSRVPVAGVSAVPVAPEPAPPAETIVPKGPTTDELMSKPFAETPTEVKPSEHPAFEFREEPGPTETASAEPAAAAANWETRADDDFSPLVSAAEPAAASEIPFAPAAEGFSPARSAAEESASSVAHAGEFMRAEAAAPIYNQAVTHSARLFLLLFLIVGLGFATTTMAVHNAPAPTAELLSQFPLVGERFTPATVPARLVALRDVHADYERTRSGQTALVIAGTAENVGMRPLHLVQIAVNLRQRGGLRVVASAAVYCGNSLSARTIAQMTPHEIEFFQRLYPQKGFVVAPSGACPFLVVFVGPPAGLNGFDISVAQAIAASGAGAVPGV
jgi:predicted Zn finger-like uncharacterized protein